MILMQDSEFKPHQPEKQVTVTIFKKEAILIQKLRKYSFGKFTVHKLNGTLVRFEPQPSELIEEDTDIDLS